ncbi:MAG: response regulator [Lachnospiraceae bacterium]|nr:response regulator [Lachnospiraceae bacterium]
MLKVLIVDDEYIMRQGLKHMIDWEGEGYVIAGEATNGDEALKLLKELKPDIIICDVVMPVLDGVDFTDAVHGMYPSLQIIILSGYDNFEYVKQTLMNGVVDYILKPTLTPEELRQVLKKAADRIPGYKKDESLGTVSHAERIRKYLTDGEEFDKEEFRKVYFFGYYRIYAVDMKSCSKTGDIREVLYNKLMRELKELQVIKYICIMLREETAVVLFNYEMHDGPSLKSFIEKTNESLCYIDKGIYGVVSSGFNDISSLLEVFKKEVENSLYLGFYDAENRLTYTEETLKEGRASYSRFDFFKFNNVLTAKQYKEAVNMLEAYNDAALNAKADPYGLKNQMKNLVYHFLTFTALSDTERQNARYSFFSRIDGARSEDDHKAAMRDIFAELVSIHGEETDRGDDRINDMLSYIAENYKEDLKLEDLANEFNFNYNYLSTYFTQHMHEGFSDYINRLRIDEACRLLKGTDTPISNVGMETGYSDHSYFSRVFKKLTGMTPSEYRREKTHETKA